MTTNKLKNKIVFLGLNYKKEVLKLASLCFCSVILIIVSIILIKELYLTLLIASVCGVLIYLSFSSYSSRIKTLQTSRNDEFISVIRYFKVFINDGFNVYQAFYHSIPMCSVWMKEMVEGFLNAIDKDKSVKPFIDFSNIFSLTSARNIMLAIYQMVDTSSSSNQLNHFEHVFSEVNANNLIDLKERKDKSLSNLSIFPLIGAGLIIMTLCFSVIFIMGDLINVI